MTLEDVTKLLGAAATLAGVCVAWVALYTWRRQIVFSDRREAAKNLLRATIELQDTYRTARAATLVPEDDRDARDRAIRDERFGRLASALDGLEGAWVEARVVWDMREPTSAPEPLGAIRQCVATLLHGGLDLPDLIPGKEREDRQWRKLADSVAKLWELAERHGHMKRRRRSWLRRDSLKFRP